MSLDYSYKNVVDSDTVMWDEKDHMLPEVQSIIFATMAVGIPCIKDEETAIKFFTRYVQYQYSNNYGEPFFNLLDVKSLIGLSTNASTFTDAEFGKRLLANLDRQARSVVNRSNEDYRQGMAGL